MHIYNVTQHRIMFTERKSVGDGSFEVIQIPSVVHRELFCVCLLSDSSRGRVQDSEDLG